MARTRKVGLDYFPLDVDFFQDIKVRKLKKAQGGKAITIYIYLLCSIYRNGYYISGDEEWPFVISEVTGYDEAYIAQVIKRCLEVGLFDMKMFEEHHVYTSKGIQERYVEVSKRRKSTITKYNLLKDDKRGNMQHNEQKNGINVAEIGINTTETAINVAGMQQSKVKKSKVFTDVNMRTHAREESSWLDEFFSEENKSNMESLLMSLGMRPDDTDRLRIYAEEAVNEWKLAGKEHYSYTDWAQHLISVIRVKCKAGSPQRVEQRRRAYDDDNIFRSKNT